jgi:nitroreductase
MRTRRSVPAKTMSGPGPSIDEIRQMAEIAARVPDHGKIVPWRFVVYGTQARERLGELILTKALEKDLDLDDALRESERTRLSRSPTVVGLISSPREHPKVPQWEQVLSCGAAGMNWLIAANAHGYDAQWITEWYAFEEDLAPHFGIRSGERMAGFIHIGTRTMPKTERARPKMSDVLSVME